MSEQRSDVAATESPPAKLCRILGIEFPVIQDGMGPFRTTQLAAAVTRAGGLGTVSSSSTGADVQQRVRAFENEIAQMNEWSVGSFAVNIPVGRNARAEVTPLSRAYLEAAIAAAERQVRSDRGLRAVITSAGSAAEFTPRLHDAGLVHIQKVAAVVHAVKSAAAGADVLIAAGAEMGGHTHKHPVHTMVLAPQVINAVDVPVVVAGGIYSAEGLAAAIAMGGAGVAMGTRFLASRDSEWHPAYRERVVASSEWDDVIFPGHLGPMRGLRSLGSEELNKLIGSGMSDDDLERWKEERMIQAMSRGEVESGLLPAGQCASAITELIDVGTFIPDMVKQARGLLDDASRSL